MTSLNDCYKFINENLTVSDVVGHLTGINVRPGSQIRCPFPDHNDRNPSFSIKKHDKSWHCFGCHKGGSQVDFIRLYNSLPDNIEALKTGYEIRGEAWPLNGEVKTYKTSFKALDQGKQSDTEKPTQTYTSILKSPYDPQIEFHQTHCIEYYDYFDNRGEPAYRVFRMLNHEGNKYFVPFTWNGQYWIKGCPPDAPKFLYNLENVKNAECVFLVEGEKDVKILNQLGFTATTWKGGADSLKKQAQEWAIFDVLSEKDVYWIPDCDDAGQKAFHESLPYLFGFANEVKKIELPGYPKNKDGKTLKDIHDYVMELSDTMTPEQIFAHILSLVENTKHYVPDYEAKSLLIRSDLSDQIERPEPVWIVDQLIPEGLTLLGGKKKARKSMIAQQIGLQVCTGVKALGYFDVNQGSCIHVSLEDDDFNWNQRLGKMLYGPYGQEPKPKNFWSMHNSPHLKSTDKEIGLLDLIKQWKRRIPDLRIVFVDVLARVLSPEQKSKISRGGSAGYNEWYDELEVIRALALNLRISIVILHHMVKGNREDIFDAFNGSNALTGVPDSLIALQKVRNNSGYQGILHWEGRRTKDVEPLALKFDSATFTTTVVGDLKEFNLTEQRQSVISTLKENGGPMKLNELFDACGEDGKYQAFKQLVHTMKKDNLLASAGRGMFKIA